MPVARDVFRMKEHFLRGIRDGRVAVRIGMRSGNADVVQKRLIHREVQHVENNQDVVAYIAGAIIGQLRGIGKLFIEGNTPNHIIVMLDKDGKPKKD